jgi:hypothetical protein
VKRIIVAILLVPIGVLVGAWFGQYVFPETALGHEFLVNEEGARVGTAQRTQLPAMVYFFPTKLSIPLVAFGYLVVVTLGAPVAALLRKRGRFSMPVAALTGLIIGAVTTWMAAQYFYSVRSAFGPQIVQLGAFIGSVSGVWYWLIAYSSLRQLTSRSSGPADNRPQS